MGPLITLALVVAVLFIFVMSAIKVVRQGFVYTIERFGKYTKAAEPGMHVIIPFVDRVGQTAHLAVQHGRDVLYVVEERAPGRAPLVTDVGVRLPAHLTASGRAILAKLPAVQVRALYSHSSAFVDRHGTGPTSLSALRAVLRETRQRGYAIENGEVTPGLSSVAACVVDPNGHPIAGVAVTYEEGEGGDAEALSVQVRRTADSLSRRIGGTPG